MSKMHEQNLLAIFKESGDRQIKKFYNINKIYYKSAGVEYEDLKQDMFIICWETITGKKINSEGKKINPPILRTEEELRKYVGGLLNKALPNTLREIPTSERTNMGVLVFSEMDEYGYHEETDPLRILNSIKKDLDSDRTLKSAYKLLYLKFVENKTEKQIAQRLNLLNKEGLPDANKVKTYCQMLIKKYGKKENLYKPIVLTGIEYMGDNHMVKMDNMISFLAEIRTMVSPKAYDIIYEKIVENNTFREIAKNKDMNHQTVKNIYDDAITLIRKNFCSDME